MDCSTVLYVRLHLVGASDKRLLFGASPHPQQSRKIPELQATAAADATHEGKAPLHQPVNPTALTSIEHLLNPHSKASTWDLFWVQ